MKIAQTQENSFLPHGIKDVGNNEIEEEKPRAGKKPTSSRKEIKNQTMAGTEEDNDN